MAYYQMLFFVRLIAAHSWAERSMTIHDGNLEHLGYPRGYVFRNETESPDAAMTYLLPPNNRSYNTILPSDLICRESQTFSNQTSRSPSLSADLGSRIVLMYQENGHVTLLNTTTPEKRNSGMVYVYGTQHSSPTNKLIDIHKVWSRDDESGRRGQLLTQAPFDDGSCYQINGSPESIRRQGLTQRRHMEFEGNDLWCGTIVDLPRNLERGAIYTLYWVWDWPTLQYEPGLPRGKTEIYTTCLDVRII